MQTMTKALAAALLSGGLAVAGVCLAAGTAQALPAPAPLNHFTWCPGHPDPNDHMSPGGPIAAMQREGWDLNVCPRLLVSRRRIPGQPPAQRHRRGRSRAARARMRTAVRSLAVTGLLALAAAIFVPSTLVGGPWHTRTHVR